MDKKKEDAWFTVTPYGLVKCLVCGQLMNSAKVGHPYKGDPTKICNSPHFGGTHAPLIPQNLGKEKL